MAEKYTPILPLKLAVELYENLTTTGHDQRLSDDLLYWLKEEYTYRSDQRKEGKEFKISRSLRTRIERAIRNKF